MPALSRMKQLLLIFLILTFFQGCITQKTVQKTFQTKNAYTLDYLNEKIIDLILEYKVKLDKRNPNGFNPQKKDFLSAVIEKKVTPREFKLLGYKQFDNPSLYLQYAFDDNAQYRNDYLIIGLYAMIYEAYNMHSLHKLTAFDYNLEKLQTLYKNLQILQWKIKTAKDSNNKYLFLTWQNNWQIELNSKTRLSTKLKDLKNLHHINTKEESLLDMSNSSFELITNQMLTYTDLAIHYRGGEAMELSLDMLTSFLML